MRMTRLHDLGLAQLLCMPEEGGEEEGEGDEPMQDPIAVKEEKVPSRDRQLVAEVA